MTFGGFCGFFGGFLLMHSTSSPLEARNVASVREVSSSTYKISV